MSIAVLVMVIIGSLICYYPKFNYKDFYEYVKKDQNISFKEVVSHCAWGEYKTIIYTAAILGFININLIWISLGSMITFLSFKIPEIKRALNE